MGQGPFLVDRSLEIGPLHWSSMQSDHAFLGCGWPQTTAVILVMGAVRYLILPIHRLNWGQLRGTVAEILSFQRWRCEFGHANHHEDAEWKRIRLEGATAWYQSVHSWFVFRISNLSHQLALLLECISLSILHDIFALLSYFFVVTLACRTSYRRR